MTDSTEFDNLCAAQIVRVEDIRKILSNYHKASKQNKTTTYLTNKLQKLEEIWKEFEETNKQIIEHPKFEENHSYFTESCAEKAEDWYNLTKRTLSDKLSSPTIKTPNPYNFPAPLSTSKLTTPSDIMTQNLIQNTTRFRLQADRRKTISNIINSINKETLSTSSHAFLESKLQTLTKYWESFEATHEEIVASATEEDLNNEYFKDEVFIKIETLIADATIALQEQLDKQSSVERVCMYQSQSVANNTTQESPSNFRIVDAQTLIPPFSGNCKDIHKFISCTDDIYATITTTSEQNNFFSLIKSKLSGDAYDILKYNQISNWPDLKSALTLNFDTKLPKSTLQARLTNSRQKIGESVKEFAQRINMTLSQLNEATYAYTKDRLLLHSLIRDNESQAITAFEDGLYDRQLQTLAKIYPDKSMKSMTAHIIEHASRLEAKQNKSCNRIISNKSITQQNYYNCYKCKNPGHLAHNCPQSLLHPNPNRINTFQESSNNERGKINTVSNKFNNIPTCRYCHKIGHTLESCRTRAANNTRNYNHFQNTQYQYPNLQKDQARTNSFRRSPSATHQTQSDGVPQINRTAPGYHGINNTAYSPHYTIQTNQTSAKLDQVSKSGNMYPRGACLGDPSQIKVTAEVHRNPDAILPVNQST